VREPLRPTASRTVVGADDGRLLALLVERLFPLAITWLKECHRRRVELPQPLPLRRKLSELRVVFRRRKEIPVRRVGPMVEPVERRKLQVLICADARGSERARLARDR